jgi:hypothetical protein
MGSNIDDNRTTDAVYEILALQILGFEPTATGIADAFPTWKD